MKKFNYYYNNQTISKDTFENSVPENWQENINEGEYSYGYYRAIAREYIINEK